MLRLKPIAAALTLMSATACFGQAATSAQVPSQAQPPIVTPSSLLNPALSEVQGMTAALNISHWKAPGSVKQATQQDVDSIQRDLRSTLPALLASADAAPGSVPPSFAVYRNVDALYDVLLRISQVANMAAPSAEASSIANALQRLEQARSSLGESILNTSQHQESVISALHREIQLARRTSVTHRSETVIDDGPVKSEKKIRRHRTVHRKSEPSSQKSTSDSGATTDSKPSPATPSH